MVHRLRWSRTAPIEFVHGVVRPYTVTLCGEAHRRGLYFNLAKAELLAVRLDHEAKKLTSSWWDSVPG
jgi:hypothetical protein